MFTVSVKMPSWTPFDDGKKLIKLIQQHFDEITKAEGWDPKTEVHYFPPSPADTSPFAVSICITTESREWVMKNHVHGFIALVTKQFPNLKGNLRVWVIQGEQFRG